MSKKKTILTLFPVLHLFTFSALGAQQQSSPETKKGKVLTYNREIFEDKKQQSHHLLERALNAKAEGNYTLARQLYGMVIKTINPTDYSPDFINDVYINLAEINYELKDYPEALKIINFIEKQKLSQGCLAKAEFLRSQLFLKAKDKESAFYTLALLNQKYHSSKWPGPMKALFIQLRDDMEANFDSLIRRAEKHYALGHYQEAETTYTQIVEAIEKEYFSPVGVDYICAKIRLRLAETAYINKNFEHSIAVLSEIDAAIEFIPALRETYFESQYLLGLCYKQMGEKEKAIASFETYLKSESYSDIPFKKEAAWELGKLYSEGGLNEQAIPLLVRTLNAKGFSQEERNRTKLLLAKAYIDQGNLRSSKIILNSLNETLPQNSIERKEWAYLAGKAYYFSKDPEAAVKQFEASLAQGKEKPGKFETDSLQFLAKIHTELWKNSGNHLHLIRAENYFKRLAEFDHLSEQTILELGKVLSKKTKIFKQNSDEEKLHSLLGKKNLLQNSQNYAQALYMRAKATSSSKLKKELLNELIDQYPNSSKYGDAFLALGKEELKETQSEEATRESIQKIADAFFYLKERNPEKASEAFLQLQSAHLFQDPSPNYKAIFTALQALDTEHPEVFAFASENSLYNYLLGMSAFYYSKTKKGQEKEGLTFLAKQALTTVAEQGVQHGSVMEEVFFNLGSLYYEDGNYHEAKRNFLAHVTHYPESTLIDKSLFYAALSSYNMEDPYPETSDLFRRVYLEHPTSPFADESYFLTFSEKSYGKGDVRALSHLEKMAQAYPESPYLVNASYYLGKNYLSQGLSYKEKGILDSATALLEKASGRFEESVGLFEHFSGVQDGINNPNLVRARQKSLRFGGEAHYNLAQISTGDKRIYHLRKAEGMLTTVANEATDPSTSLLLAKVYSSLNHTGPAINQLEQALAKTPEGKVSANLYINLADLNYREGNFKRSLKYTKKALTHPKLMEEDKKQASLLAGLVFVSLGKEEEALTTAETLKEMGVSGGNWAFFQGRLSMLKQEYRPAVNHFKEALADRHSLMREEECRYSLAKSLSLSAQSQKDASKLIEAEKVARKLWNSEPNEANTLLLADILKTKYESFKRSEDAIALNQLLAHEDIFNSNVTLSQALWDRLEVIQNDEEKYQIYSRLAKLEDPSSEEFSQVIFELGNLEFERANHDPELLKLAQGHLKETFERLEKSEPQKAYEALLGHLEALLATNQREDTLLALETIFSLEKDYPHIMLQVERGARYFYVKGLACFQASKESLASFSSKDSLPYFAKESFESIVENYPESPYLADAYFYLGKTSIELAQVDQAAHYFELLTTKMPEDFRTPEALFFLAKVSQFTHRPWSETRKHLETIYTKFPASPQAEKAYFGYFNKKDYFTSQKALDHLSNFSSLFPKSSICVESNFILGKAYQALGEEQNSPSLLKNAADYFSQAQSAFNKIEPGSISEKLNSKYAFLAKMSFLELFSIEKSLAGGAVDETLHMFKGTPIKDSPNYLDQLALSGYAAMLEGNHQEAQSYFNTFTSLERGKSHVAYDQVLWLKGKTEFELGNLEEARSSLKRALTDGAMPSSTQREAALLLGYAAIETDQLNFLAFAQPHLSKVSNYPKAQQGNANFLLGKYHLNENSFGTAVKFFNEALEQNDFANSKWAREAKVSLALSYYETGNNQYFSRLEKAQNLLREIEGDLQPEEELLFTKVSLAKYQLKKNAQDFETTQNYISQDFIPVDEDFASKLLAVATSEKDLDNKLSLLQGASSSSFSTLAIYPYTALELAITYFENGNKNNHGFALAAANSEKAFRLLIDEDRNTAEQAFILTQKARLKTDATDQILQVFQALTDLSEHPIEFQESLRGNEEVLFLIAASAEELLDSPFLASQNNSFILKEGAKAIALFLDRNTPNASTLSILFRFAEKAHRANQPELADPLLTYFLEAAKNVEMPDPDKVADALYMAWLTKEKLLASPEETKELKQRIYTEFPNSSHSDEAYFLTFTEEDYTKRSEEALAHLEAFESRFPSSPFLVKVNYFLGLDAWKKGMMHGGDLALLEKAESHLTKTLVSIDQLAPQFSESNHKLVSEFKESLFQSLTKKGGASPDSALVEVLAEKAKVNKDSNTLNQIVELISTGSHSISESLGTTLVSLTRENIQENVKKELLTHLIEEHNKSYAFYPEALLVLGSWQLALSEETPSYLPMALKNLELATHLYSDTLSHHAKEAFLALQAARIKQNTLESTEKAFNDLAFLPNLNVKIQSNLRNDPTRASMIVETAQVLLEAPDFSGEKLELLFSEGASAIALLLNKNETTSSQFDFIYSLGMKLYEHDFLEEAAPLLKEYALQSEDLEKGPEGLYLSWQSLQKLGKPEEEVKALKHQLVKKFPTSKYAPEAAYSFFSESEYEKGSKESIHHLVSITKSYPDHPVTFRAHFFLGRHYYNQAQSINSSQGKQDLFKKAFEHYTLSEKLYHSFKTNDSFSNMSTQEIAEKAALEAAKCQRNISELSNDQKPLNLSLEYLKKIYPTSTYYVEALHETARAQQILENYEGAVETLKKLQTLAKTREEQGKIFFSLGNAYQKLEIYESALENFEKAEGYTSQDLSKDLIDYKIGELSLALGAYSKALEHLARTTLETKDSSLKNRAAYLMAQVHKERGETQKARTWFKAVAESDDTSLQGKAQEEMEALR